jgi:tRNA pseudouridine32 synthase/23S rRNA pseudouridine746 synthase
MKNPTCFIPLNEYNDQFPLPEKLDFPFFYEPTSLAIYAAEEVQKSLIQDDFSHNFGIENSERNGAIGKMFGILIVQNQKGELGYLKAFSGKLADKNDQPGFVPPVFDILKKDGFFKLEELNINKLNERIEEIENDITYLKLKKNYEDYIQERQNLLDEFRRFLKAKKKERDELRKLETHRSTPDQFEQLIEQLKKESISQQLEFKSLTIQSQEKLTDLKNQFEPLEKELADLKTLRKQKSNELQKKIFEHYTFINQKKEEKSLLAIFQETVFDKPPAGAGECAAPKLFQYAFKHDLTPICMAEFWWGMSPDSEIRVHKQYYSACRGKCEPILNHMLSASNVEVNPLNQQAEITDLAILYEDEWIVAVDKPAEFLSVPGKRLTDSVLTRLHQLYPEATGPLLLHRLDMSTSGILVAAKTKEVHKHLQHQFIKRSINKKYVALLEGKLEQLEGEVNLPLIGDITDRPKQKVCFEIGKKSRTLYKVLEQKNGRSLIEFKPITGRTHQLRVHAAHHLGLNCPIVGDDLYGLRNSRLHLHASELTIYHPILKEEIYIQSPCKFNW